MLQRWRDTLARVLIADLNQPQHTGEFADMFAQTLAYGLFSARTMDATPDSFSRQEAQALIPATNPFLRDFFYEITGPRLEEEGFVRFVDDLVALLANTDMDSVLSTFGKRTRQEDPVIHFYETFLAAYDPRLREARGVYYTPEPVVQYIVRSVDHLLKTRFGLKDGLADRSMTQIQNRDPNLRVQGSKEMRKTRDVHRVLVLDPACGTGTFLYAMVDLIRQRFMQRGDAGDWSDYVRLHLLPRIFGFELLMAPYAVAHFKLGLQLAGRDLPEEERAHWAYNFSSNERLHVYLTNTLDESHEYSYGPLFAEGVARESIEANEVKTELPIMVVMGNPPYSSVSSNMGKWIQELIDTYRLVDGKPLGERKLWLQDDYVKFIRFGQWRIESSGTGILAFVSNHGYLDNPTFRGMRQSLINSFSEIYVLNLHGNSKKKERSPDGSADENVFDIQQGVAISIFVKRNEKLGPARIYYADLWGARKDKYDSLFTQQIESTDWVQLAPKSPFYLLRASDETFAEEYEQAWLLTSIMPANASGVVTSKDRFVIDYSDQPIIDRVQTFLDPSQSDDDIKTKFGLSENYAWRISDARRQLRDVQNWQELLTDITYRPFDNRRIIYHPSIVWRIRYEVMRHMLKSNLALISARSNKSASPDHFFCSRNLVEAKCGEATTQSTTFPLYVYPKKTQQASFVEDFLSPEATVRQPNLNPLFIEDLSLRLGLSFIYDGKGDLTKTLGPEDVFNYMYAIFHSPTYRQRYGEFLKMDYPRLPLTSDLELFKTLAALGERLVALHLMEADGDGPTPSFPIKGDNRVDAVRYTPPTESGDKGRVYINKAQYFEGVPPDAWEFHIGGYQVAEKWLKDRKGRELT